MKRDQFSKKIIGHGIVQASPLPSSAELSEYYASSYYQESDGKRSSYDVSYTDDELSHKKMESRLTLMAALANLKNKDGGVVNLLDLGCGEGFLLSEAFEKGINITGVDFSSFGVKKWNPAVEAYCQFGDIYEYLERARTEENFFDIIVLKNVLEHVIDPANLCHLMAGILKDGGVIVATFPNDYSPLQSLALKRGYINREFWFAPPDHLHYFNAETIYPFAKENNLEVVDIYSSFPIDFFLFHPGSNYVSDPSKGKSAHTARLSLDLMMAQKGEDKLLNMYRSMAQCGVGRDITVVMKSI
jgi:2-polyprenyl-3-methyl-5-hydroxy-6-metoxy-1,4-benzoquinol methylase